jgi:mono/diheme cytochrome c family protein
MTTKNPSPAPAAGGKLRPQILLSLGVAAVWLILLGILAAGQSAPPAAPAGPLNWTATIGPLLEKECVVCHGDSGGLSLDTHENALRGGRRGPDIIPGQSSQSRLVRALRGTEPGLARMPLNREPLPDAIIDLIARWIDAGAPQ